MRFREIKSYFCGTLRGRLILRVAAVHAVLMTIFIVDLTLRQYALLLDYQEEKAIALAQSLSTSAAVWIASDDLAGLQELVESLQRYPELQFAMLTDERGLVLAHTDKTKRGLFLLDMPHGSQQTTLVKTKHLVDVAIPAMLGNRQVGWARIGINQESLGNEISSIILIGIGYAVMAIIIGSLIAWVVGRRITSRLYAVQETINKVRTGEHARSAIAGTDEAASIALEFNALLDTLEERDISLVKSENKYRLLLQNIRTAVVVYGADLRINISNPMAQELLGISEEQLQGMTSNDPAWTFVRDDGSTMPIEEHPVNRTITIRNSCKDLIVGVRHSERNEIRWCLTNTEPMWKEGNINEVIVTFVDITERRKAEQNLVLMNFALNNVHESALLIDEKSHFQYVNNESCHILGYTRAELLNLCVPDIDPDLPSERWPSHWNELKEKHSLVFQGRHQTKEGCIVPVEICANYFEFNGLSYNLALVRDITERKQVLDALYEGQQVFRTLVENSLDIIARYDRDCKRIYVNPVYLKTSQLPRTDLLNTAPMQISPLPTISAEKLQKLLRKVLDRGVADTVDVLWPKEDDFDHWYNISAVPEFNREGQVVSVMTVSRDITERKHMEEENRIFSQELERRVMERTADAERTSTELKENQMALMNIVEDLNEKTLELEQANAKLKELDQLKSMFIASMSHELRTPLNSIIGYSSILLNEWVGSLNDEQKENIAAVHRSGRHLLSLINDVIDVSKIEAGKIESVVEDVEIGGLISEAIEPFRNEIKKKGLEVIVQAPEHLILRTDRRRLLQCLLNLVSNAVKYTRQGSIRMNVEQVRDESMVKMTVEDTGVGVLKEDLQKLFLPFVRLKTPLEKAIPGTGLGLYLTKKLVQEILKGELSVTSTYGTGSRFSLCVPVALDE